MSIKPSGVFASSVGPLFSPLLTPPFCGRQDWHCSSESGNGGRGLHNTGEAITSVLHKLFPLRLENCISWWMPATVSTGLEISKNGKENEQKTEENTNKQKPAVGRESAAPCWHLHSAKHQTLKCLCLRSVHTFPHIINTNSRDGRRSIEKAKPGKFKSYALLYEVWNLKADHVVSESERGHLVLQGPRGGL